MFLFRKKHSAVVKLECLASVPKLNYACLTVIMLFLQINDIFNMRCASQQLYEVTNGNAKNSIWREPWLRFILASFPRYQVTHQDRENPLRQYLNYRSLPKYARAPIEENALVKATWKNHYPAVKFLLKTGANTEEALYLSGVGYKPSSIFDLFGYGTVYNAITPLFIVLYLMPFYRKKSTQIDILRLLLQYGARYDTEVEYDILLEHPDTNPNPYISKERIDFFLDKTSWAKVSLINLARAEDAFLKNRKNSNSQGYLQIAYKADPKIFKKYVTDLQKSKKSMRLLKGTNLKDITCSAQNIIDENKNNICSLM